MASRSWSIRDLIDLKWGSLRKRSQMESKLILAQVAGLVEEDDLALEVLRELANRGLLFQHQKYET